MAESLVQLGKSTPQKTLEKLIGGAIADKFFISGVIFSIIGIGWLGTHLWLKLNGVSEIGANYLELRQLHILIQFYLFFGLFILGFIAQAAPKIFSAPELNSPYTILWIPSLLLGVALWQLLPNPMLGQFVISLTFISAIVYLARFLTKSKHRPPLPIAFWIIITLFSFAASPFINTQRADGALLVFILTLVPIIIGISLQFIVGFLDGKKLSFPGVLTLIFIFLSLLFTATLAYRSPEIGGIWNIVGLITLVLLATHAKLTRHYIAFKQLTKNSVASAFSFGFFWAFVGALHLSYFGSLYLDQTLHLFAIGWATSLIIGVSVHIISFISNQPNRFRLLSLALLALWQIVVVGRGLTHIILLPQLFSWVVLTSACIVIVGWLGILFYAESAILKKKKSTASFQ